MENPQPFLIYRFFSTPQIFMSSNQKILNDKIFKLEQEIKCT